MMLLPIPQVAGAAAAPITSGTLSWTQKNVFDGAAPANTDRTWLGYLSRVGAPGNPNGVTSPVAPATGPTVDASSPKGVDSTWQFGATSGTYDVDTGKGDLVFAGGLRYTGPAIGIEISIENPQITLDGLSGTLTSSGNYTGGTQQAPQILPYTTQPVYTLDLSNATVTLKADGSRQIGGIAPTVAVTGLPFPGNYPAGVAGPDRTPNTFGSFALTIKPGAQPVVTGPQGPAGPAGPAGPVTTIRSYVAYLKKAPYTGKRRNEVTIRRSGKIVATGTIRGRVLRVTLADGVKSISGKYTIKLSGGSKRATSVVVG
ncbi:MAG: HtaA domain-containing protein [Baekduia sp.]